MDYFIHDLSNRLAHQINATGTLQMGMPLATLVLGFCSLICAVLLIYLADSLVQSIFRCIFFARYDITVNRRVRLFPFPAIGKGRYRLRFPHWRYPNVNGSKDHRRKSNPLRKGKGILYFGYFRITSKDPIIIVWLVNALRRKRYIIGLTEPEARKLDTARQRQKEIAESNSIGNIRNMFEYRETDFEEYCAELFRLEGYEAKTTPPTADGGYDIDMTDPDGRRCFVECKCYSRNTIGRPMLQKLYGANHREEADRLIFITTTSFSKEARDYAGEVDMELIIGKKLLSMAERHKQAIRLKAAEPPLDEWLLNYKDVASNYPPDCQPSPITL